MVEIMNKIKPGTEPARADRRPQYYDIAEGSGAQCSECMRTGYLDYLKRLEVVFADPANSKPSPDGSVYTLCIHHLPADAVIYDPMTGLCRDKGSTVFWNEEEKKILQ